MARRTFTERAKKWLGQQSKVNLTIAGLILLAVVYVVGGFGYDKDYQRDVVRELQLARLLCENALPWINADPERLKMGQGDLRQVTIQGEKIELRRVKYPKIIFLESGFKKINGKETARDLYCEIRDPRSSSTHHYYKFETGEWTDKVRFKR